MSVLEAGPGAAGGDHYARDVSALPTPKPSRHVVTVEAFERMIEAGVFGADERVELIEGEMLDMSPIGEAWVVDLNGGVIDVATEPSPEGYGRVVQHVPGATAVPGAFPDISVPVSQALGLPGKR